MLSKTGVDDFPGEAFFHDAQGSNLICFCFVTMAGELEDTAGWIK